MNKRQKKKIQKKQLQKSFVDFGVIIPKNANLTQLQALTETTDYKRAYRNQQQTERRKQYINGWKSKGFTDEQIKRLGLRAKNPAKATAETLHDYKKQYANYKRQKTRKDNVSKRTAYLQAHGVEPNYYNTRSDKAMYDALGHINPLQVYKAKQYLALCFTSLDGDNAIVTTAEYKNYSMEQLKQIIKNSYTQSLNNPKGSGSLKCVFQIFSGSKSECNKALTDFDKRGYNLAANKLTDRRYYRLFNRNDWTMREFAEMMCVLFSQSSNEYIIEEFDQLKDFVQESELPFEELFKI